LIWWLVIDIVGWPKLSLLTSELEPILPWKLWAIVSAFQQKKPELIWTSRTQIMS
jgi:hypothetical protein